MKRCGIHICRGSRLIRILFAAVLAVALCPSVLPARDRMPVKLGASALDSISAPMDVNMIMRVDTIAGDTLFFSEPELKQSAYDVWEERDLTFNPDPTRAVWLSALFPGLGQIYNRRYWKLPIIIGGYLGLSYATTWNNGMLNDYTRAYRDIMDSDPATNSYMNFFPPNTDESSLDRTWLTNVMQSRKNYFRRNRDLCIIGMVGVYLLAMVDAYVDASLSHFDITPDLTMDVQPALFYETRGMKPAVGLNWAINF